jgi:uncharacterized protein YpuA (DUF1002 family)
MMRKTWSYAAVVVVEAAVEVSGSSAMAAMTTMLSNAVRDVPERNRESRLRTEL